MSQKAVFLDRDGVINQEVSYLSDPERMVLLPNVGEAIDYLHSLGYIAIVTTNQAGVARGMYSAKDTQRVHARIQKVLLSAGHTAIDGFYCCFHHPEFNGVCNCRKPKPGMLISAANDFDIDLKQSVMIGDRISDLNAGINAGCKASVLVLTGYGCNEKTCAIAAGFPIAVGLLEALKQLKLDN